VTNALPEKPQTPAKVAAYKDTLFEFPTEYPLKVAGKNTPGFEKTVIEIVSRHVLDFDHATVTARESKGGKYLAVSVSFTAQSKSQLDALYQDLTDHVDIVWAL
jgi:uncharacterized protein